MSIFDLVKNTFEGVTQVAVNVVKLPIAVIVSPLDDGQQIKKSASSIVEGVEKIGKSETDRSVADQ